MTTPRTDVQAVLTVIGRGEWPNPAPPSTDGVESLPESRFSANDECIGIDLSRTDLHHVRFEGVARPRLCLEDASLERAELRGADLTSADLEDTNRRSG